VTKVLYVSSVPSPTEFEEIARARRPGIDHASYGMSESGFKFHTLIMEGLVSSDDCQVLSLVGRSVNRKMYWGGYWPARRERCGPKLSVHHVGFLNVPIVKQVQVTAAIFVRTIAWLLKHRREERKVIIMDASYITVIPAVILASGASSAKKAAIFADIYSYMGKVRDASDKPRIGSRVLRTLMPHVYRQLDTFVLLTEQMNGVVNSRGKPHIVMEGLVDIGMRSSQNELSGKAEHPTVLYAGALRKQYGLENLVRGFEALVDPRVRLEIYGEGDYVPDIERAALRDGRISYGGLVPNKEVVEHEKRAWVLVNPRPASQEFTRYSFPSKNMEYMVSGTPVLTTRLPGMPAEYYGYVSTIDGDDADAITDALSRELARDPSELHAQGERARSFVLAKKNNVVQTARILEAMEQP